MIPITRERLLHMINQITVEPIIFLNFLALPFFFVSQHAILYKSVCIQYYSSSIPGDANVCENLKNYSNIEDHIQQDTSTWTMYLSLSYFGPAIVSDIFLGAWSDQNGRKMSILVGLAGLVAMCVASISLAVYPYMPLYILVLANIVSGLTGYMSIVIISTMAYLADVVADPDKLTFRMIVVTSFRWLADLIGSFATSFALQYLNLAISTLLAQGFFALAFFYTLTRIRQLPPSQMQKLAKLEDEKMKNSKKHAPIDQTIAELKNEKIVPQMENEKSVSQLKDDTSQIKTQKSSFCNEIAHTTKYIIRLYKDVGLTVFRRRQNHKRAYIFICTMIYFCLIAAEVGLQHGPIMSLYVFHRPFYWSASDLGIFRGVESVCGLVGSIVGALIKKYMHLDEISIMLWGIGSGFFHLTIIGVSKVSWMLYLALIISTIHSLLVPAMKSFLIHQVEKDEVGKTLAANGIAADVAFMCSTLVFTNIYSATVTSYAGTVFIIGAGSYFICFCFVFWMFIDRNRNERRERDSCPSTVRSTAETPPIAMASLKSSDIEGRADCYL